MDLDGKGHALDAFTRYLFPFGSLSLQQRFQAMQDIIIMFLCLFLVPPLSLNRGMSNKRSDFSVVMLPSDTKAVVKFSREASFSRAASAE